MLVAVEKETAGPVKVSGSRRCPRGVPRVTFATLVLRIRGDRSLRIDPCPLSRAIAERRDGAFVTRRGRPRTGRRGRRDQARIAPPLPEAMCALDPRGQQEGALRERESGLRGRESDRLARIVRVWVTPWLD